MLDTAQAAPAAQSAMPSVPIVKWAGGKGRLLPQLRPLLPAGVEHMRYIEPFAGGAALFFALAPQRAVLSDINPDLIATYQAVRDELPAVIAHLTRLACEHSTEHYYEVRAAYNQSTQMQRALRAAMFIYLNRTCYNGLHRVNRRGEFNVPIGRYAQPRILDPDSLATSSALLQRAELCTSGFEHLIDTARPGDFIYLDPPYIPLSRTADFTAYAKDRFDRGDQVRLRDVFVALTQRRCKVMLSNSNAPAVRTLYQGHRIVEVRVQRAINSKATGRGAVTELVVLNYP